MRFKILNKSIHGVYTIRLGHDRIIKDQWSWCKIELHCGDSGSVLQGAGQKLKIVLDALEVDGIQ